MNYYGYIVLPDLIDGERKEAKQQFDPIELIVRSSTAPLHEKLSV